MEFGCDSWDGLSAQWSAIGPALMKEQVGYDLLAVTIIDVFNIIRKTTTPNAATKVYSLKPTKYTVLVSAPVNTPSG